MYTKYVKQNVADILTEKTIQTDLYTADGVLLLAKNTKVDEGISNLLHELSSIKFEVYRRVDLDNNELKFDKVLELDKEVKSRAVQTLAYMFSPRSDIDSSISAVQDLSSTLTEVILGTDSLSVSLESLKCSDEYTFKHSLDVAAIATLLGRGLGLKKAELQDLATAGLLHDLGKRKIPTEILHKQGTLTDEEFEIIKQHPLYTYELLKDVTSIGEPVKQACLQHHEQWNGSGYPYHLEGRNINDYARVLAVADVFDALVTDRPYHKHYTPSDAIEMMTGMVGHFDMDIYKLFLQTVVLYPVGTVVTLSNGKLATIVENHKENILRPSVKLVDENLLLNLYDDSTTYHLTIINSVNDTDASDPSMDKMAVERKESS